MAKNNENKPPINEELVVKIADELRAAAADIRDSVVDKLKADGKDAAAEIYKKASEVRLVNGTKVVAPFPELGTSPMAQTINAVTRSGEISNKEDDTLDKVVENHHTTLREYIEASKITNQEQQEATRITAAKLEAARARAGQTQEQTPPPPSSKRPLDPELVTHIAGELRKGDESVLAVVTKYHKEGKVPEIMEAHKLVTKEREEIAIHEPSMPISPTTSPSISPASSTLSISPANSTLTLQEQAKKQAEKIKKAISETSSSIGSSSSGSSALTPRSITPTKQQLESCR